MFRVQVFFEFVIFLLFCDQFMCSVTDRTDCHQVVDNQLDAPLAKKRFKRFLYPQILLINLGNRCGCNSNLGYGRYGGLGGLGGGLGMTFERPTILI